MKEFRGTKGDFIHVADRHEFCDSGDYQCDEIIKVGNKCIAQCFSGVKITEEEAESNAKLFTASKDLLESLQDIVISMDRYFKDPSQEELPDMHDAKQAITKALGE